MPAAERDDLVVIGYAGTSAAAEAARRLLRPGTAPGIARGAVAVVACDADGGHRITTYGRPIGLGRWGLFWRRVLLEPAGPDADLHRRVRAVLSPGTSGLLVVAPASRSATVVDAAGGHSRVVLRLELPGALPGAPQPAWT